MNFLAHTYLSCSDENLLLGNVLADFIRNKDIPALPKPFHIGIDLHRKIDSFTDTHPQVLQVNKHFHEVHHKYAPVVTDILFDYVLANNWEKYSGETLSDFTSNIYHILFKHQDTFPERKKKSILNMINNDFLMNYTNLEGLRFTFEHMDKRTKYTANFVKALDHLDQTYPHLEAAFKKFFPDLIQEVDAFCDC